MNTIGVDVDSVNLVCQIRRNGKDYPSATFSNDPVGHRRFVKWATKRGQPARVCMEATGVYSLPFALMLQTVALIEVMVVNPKAIKHFATANLQRGKTDALDAAVILEFLERMPFRRWQPPADDILEIQQITRRIVQLTADLTRERNRHKAAVRLGALGRVVANDTAVTMRHLERRIQQMEQASLELMEAIPELHTQLTLITTTTGIAKKTGPRILIELAALPDDMTAAQWVAHAGLDPRPYESGVSTNKPRRISKAGNRYLRDALFFPALVASQKDKHVKAYYQHLLQNGKKPMQAIVAIMRKLLLAIWGMLHHQQPWDGNKFYKLT